MTTRTTTSPQPTSNRSMASRLPMRATIVATAACALLTASPPPSQAQTGPVLNEVAKLLADDGAAGDYYYFGQSVSLSGDTIVIGAQGDDDNGDASGSVYVFVRDRTGVWTTQEKLTTSDGVEYDQFGASVAISGNMLVAGAPYDSDNGHNSGSVYVFERNSDGDWTQQAKLLAGDGTAEDEFGFSVAISGDTAIVGASYDDDNGPGSGSAYVFTRDANGGWMQQDKLLADDGAAIDRFGTSVFISGDSALVGAFRGDGNIVDSGSVYVFVRDAVGDWTQQAKLAASDGNLHDSFGNAVALSGDTAIVGATAGDSDVINTGSAYVFVRDPHGDWTQQAKLLAADGVGGYKFGISVEICDDTVVVGSVPTPNIVQTGDDLALRDTLGFEEVSGGVSGPGAAYVFMRDSDGVWTQRIKLLASDGANGDDFGISVGLAGDTIVAGASTATDNGYLSGAAYVFNLRPADLNANGVVDGDDLSALLSQWETDGTADLNSDGVVDGVDLATLLTNWG